MSPSPGFGNRAYVSFEHFSELERLAATNGATPVSSRTPQVHVEISGLVFLAEPHKDTAAGKIGLNSLQRKLGKFMLNQAVDVRPFAVRPALALATISLRVDLLAKVSCLHAW